MSVGRFAVFFGPGILEILIQRHNPAKGWHQKITAYNEYNRNAQRGAEIRGKYFDLFGFIFEIRYERFPIVIDMQKQCDEKQQAQVDMYVSPIRFGQSP